MEGLKQIQTDNVWEGNGFVMFTDHLLLSLLTSSQNKTCVCESLSVFSYV